MPEGDRKDLNPRAPAACRLRSSRPSRAFPGTMPAQAATSTAAAPRQAARLALRLATLVVTGSLFSGMSSSVVMPPAAAARVAEATPSQSSRPGVLMCTCTSTRPGPTRAEP